VAADALIINADDLGLWPSVDRGIFAAWATRVISDSTVFANTPDLAAILAHATAENLPVGVHLNLTHGKPLSDPAEIPALVTADGVFMKRTAWMLPLPVTQVRLELFRQVERLLAYGWRPSHLDSHHHIHTYPEVQSVVVELAQQHGLPVRAVNEEIRQTLGDAGVATPDHFSMVFYGEYASVETLMQLVEECPGGVLEIMTHPGYVTPGLPSSYSEEREQELRVLSAPRWREYLTAQRIPLIGYDALRR